MPKWLNAGIKEEKKGQKNKKQKRKENLQRRKTANEHIINKSLCQSLFLPSSIQAVNSVNTSTSIIEQWFRTIQKTWS